MHTDPWTLTTTQPLDLKHRDAFIGNGRLGQRISPWGDGSAYEGRSQSFRYGFWGRDESGNEALMELPVWAVLDFRHPGPMGRACEQVLHHTQALDLRTGTVETRYRVEGSHPWNMPMDTELKRRIVDYYRAHYPPRKIMMGSAIDGIIDCQLGRFDHAMEAFRDLLPHFHPPYFTASESPVNDCMNFLTGIGGLLQLMLMGFGGIRVDEQGLHIPDSPPAANLKVFLRRNGPTA